METSSDGTTTSSGMEGLQRRSSRSGGSNSNNGSETTTSTTRSSQLQSPFISMFQRATIPTLILERISECLSSMDVLHLSVTCQVLQQKLQLEWHGWPCTTCRRPLFVDFLPPHMAAVNRMDTSSSDDDRTDSERMTSGSSGSGSNNTDSPTNMEESKQQGSASASASASSSDPPRATSTTGSSSDNPQHRVSSRTSSDNTQQQRQQEQPFVQLPPPPAELPKVGGCHLCLGRRTCPNCTERCIECGITACEEGHASFDGEMCINAVCTDDFQPIAGRVQHHPPRARCRGCLNKCRSCEDAYCTTCSSISLCRYCGNSECPYCQDQCFDEAYGYDGNIVANANNQE